MPNVKERGFDPIHDTQYIYRQLLEALSRPGQIGMITSAHAKLSNLPPVHAMIMCFAMTLFDGEVSFSIAMDDNEALQALIRKQTFSRVQETSLSDYIIAEGNSEDVLIQKLFAEMNKGTLIRPEGGATLFILIEGFAMNDSIGECWTLTGPGIQDECTLCVQGLSGTWIDQRAIMNAEYPMGVDIVLFTKSGQITALPRTTIMRGADI